MSSGIDHLIINSPYEEPQQRWEYNHNRMAFELAEGRRPSGYTVASTTKKLVNDLGVFVQIPLVNKVRGRVKEWRENGFQGVSGVTKQLLEHWRDSEARQNRFFFCQLEAIETLIWLAEAPDAEKVGVDIPSDGGEINRICSKMATGTGKTIVMAMLIAWQSLNKINYPTKKGFAKDFLIVAPNLTVRSRLSVLVPAGEGNYYDAFEIVPLSLREQLRQSKVVVRNWHALAWDTEEKIAKKRSVDKRGEKSDEAYAREVLGELANSKNFIVINDEAHHAWRIPAGAKLSRDEKKDAEEATIWIGGLDRLNKARGVQTVYDFSATPFIPSGKNSTYENLFGWIVSDFGAHTVTHIMGLRAFFSQLLCEQVVGRGLRRTSYDVDKETGLFSPEYVNIFGVPFAFMPHESPKDSEVKPTALTRQ